MFWSFILIICTFSQCKSVKHIFRSGSAYILNSSAAQEYCWNWHSGERFFIVAPYRTNGVRIELYGGHTGTKNEQLPDVTLVDQNPPFITMLNQGSVYATARVPAGGSFFISGIDIPITSCLQGIRYSTRVNETWNGMGKGECLISAGGFRVRFRLSEALPAGSHINVYLDRIPTPNFRLRTESEWSDWFLPPVVFESHGHGVLPPLYIQSDDFPKLGRVPEQTGFAQSPNRITGTAVLCLLIAVVIITTMTVCTCNCYWNWIRRIGTYHSMPTSSV